MRYNLIALCAPVIVALAFSAAPVQAQRMPRQVVHQQVVDPWSAVASFDRAAVKRYIYVQLAFEDEARRCADVLSEGAASRETRQANRRIRAAMNQHLNALADEVRRAREDLKMIQRDYRRNYQGSRRSLLGTALHSERSLTSWAVINQILIYERQLRGY